MSSWKCGRHSLWWPQWFPLLGHRACSSVLLLDACWTWILLKLLECSRNNGMSLPRLQLAFSLDARSLLIWRRPAAMLWAAIWRDTCGKKLMSHQHSARPFSIPHTTQVNLKVDILQWRLETIALYCNLVKDPQPQVLL